MRKHKSVISILLAVMMIFTFMPAMAFAEPDVNPVKSREYTSVSWSEDYHTATVGTKTVYSDGTTEGFSVDFDFYDDINGVAATKTDATKGYIKYFVARAYNQGAYVDGTVDYTLYAAKAVSNEGIDAPFPNNEAEYVWVLFDGEDQGDDAEDIVDYSGEEKAIWLTDSEKWDGATFVKYTAAKTVLHKNIEQDDVYDATYMNAVSKYNAWKSADKDNTLLSVNAGRYSAWKAGSKNADDYNEAELSYFGGWDASKEDEKEYFTVEYPEYAAYEYDVNAANKKVNKELSVVITLNASAISADLGPSKVSTAKRTIGLEPNVQTPDNAFHGAWYIEGDDQYDEYNLNEYADFNGKYIVKNATSASKPVYGIKDNVVTYNGKAHSVVFEHMPKNVTVKYFVSGTSVAKNSIKDSQWVDTLPEIKNAGTYFVYVQFTSEKSNISYIFDAKRIEVKPYTVTLTFTQDELTAEYGKYTKAELENVIASLVTIGTTPDSADKVAEAFNKYRTFIGLFEDAGRNDVTVNVDTQKLAADKDLAAAVANYTFGADTMTLTVEKVTNSVELKAGNKTFKASKKTKKLAKNKSFKVKATSDYGTPVFKKLSGNKLIKVSKSGKVTVKKGLKKGKHKVKIQALVKGTANYGQVTDTKTIVVKVK